MVGAREASGVCVMLRRGNVVLLKNVTTIFSPLTLDILGVFSKVDDKKGWIFLSEILWSNLSEWKKFVEAEGRVNNHDSFSIKGSWWFNTLTSYPWTDESVNYRNLSEEERERLILLLEV